MFVPAGLCLCEEDEYEQYRYLRVNSAFGMEPCGTRAVGTADPWMLL